MLHCYTMGVGINTGSREGFYFIINNDTIVHSDFQHSGGSSHARLKKKLRCANQLTQCQSVACDSGCDDTLANEGEYNGPMSLALRRALYKE